MESLSFEQGPDSGLDQVLHSHSNFMKVVHFEPTPESGLDSGLTKACLSSTFSRLFKKWTKFCQDLNQAWIWAFFSPWAARTPSQRPESFG